MSWIPSAHGFNELPRGQRDGVRVQIEGVFAEDFFRVGAQSYETLLLLCRRLCVATRGDSPLSLAGLDPVPPQRAGVHPELIFDLRVAIGVASLLAIASCISALYAFSFCAANPYHFRSKPPRKSSEYPRPRGPSEGPAARAHKGPRPRGVAGGKSNDNT